MRKRPELGKTLKGFIASRCLPAPSRFLLPFFQSTTPWRSLQVPWIPAVGTAGVNGFQQLNKSWHLSATPGLAGGFKRLALFCCVFKNSRTLHRDATFPASFFRLFARDTRTPSNVLILNGLPDARSLES
jgi:hypothetical protein